MPLGRFAHAAESITSPSGDPLVYAFGGIDADINQEATEESSVQVYNARTDTWSARAPMPGGAAKTNGAKRIGHKIYLSGGGVDVQSAPDLWLKRVIRYDPSLDRWTQLADMPHPSGLGVSGVIDGKLFVLTGYDNEPANGRICPEYVCPTIPTRRFFRYDPGTNTWSNRPWCPNFHVEGAAGVIGGKLYVVGGTDQDGISRKLDIYDPVTNRWTSGAPMPAARTAMAGVVAGEKLFVLGPGVEGSETFVYNPVTNSWSQRASIPTPRAHFGAAKVTVDGKARIVTVGGNGGNPSGTTTEIYTPW